MKAEGFRGMYRGFGLTALTQSPASALWWGSYGAAQHIIWRYSKLVISCNHIITVLLQHGILHISYEKLHSLCFLIFRSLGYRDDLEEKPSHMEMVTVQATAGMVAGACSSVITTPIDTIKTRLQVL